MPAVSFYDLTAQAFVAARRAAKETVTATTREHHENWQNRFGKNELISDDSGVPGSAPELAWYTIQRKGHDRMLEDATKMPEGSWAGARGDENFPGYDVPLMHSLDWYVNEIEWGPGTYMIMGTSQIQNPVFPINEWGLFHPKDGGEVPQRSTLLPTRLEVSEGFVDNLLLAYTKATGLTLARNARLKPGFATQPRLI